MNIILFFVLLPHLVETDSSRSTMKYQLQLLIFILLCLAGRLDASPLYDYGLYLKSHAVPAPERSTLYSG